MIDACCTIAQWIADQGGWQSVSSAVVSWSVLSVLLAICFLIFNWMKKYLAENKMKTQANSNETTRCLPSDKPPKTDT